MDNTIIQQGRFTSTGEDVTINFRAGVDWVRLINVSVAQDAGVVAKQGVIFYWQLGMPRNEGLVQFKSNAANAGDSIQMVENIFYPFDSSVQPNGALTALTAISAAAIPVVTSAGSNLTAGNVVRIFDTNGAEQLGGFDFTVGYNTLSANTFSLDYMSQLGFVGGAGNFRLIAQSGPLYQPSTRLITKISLAELAVVTFSVTHNYKVGQEIRFVVPAAYGMTEMNGLTGTIVAVNLNFATGNTITVDIDSTAFTPFAFPDNTGTPFSPAVAVPFGENTAAALAFDTNLLDDAVQNTGIIGIRVVGGTHDDPAGEVGEVIMWQAGSVFSVDNQ